MNNLLNELSKYQLDGMKWVCRKSTTGCGLRIHQSPSGEFLTPADAVKNFLEDNPSKCEAYTGPCFRIKPEFSGETFAWPCEREPDRIIELFDTDVLTQDDNGTWAKHTGIYCCNIIIPNDRLERWPYEPQLKFI